jgi:hypothetical protein
MDIPEAAAMKPSTALFSSPWKTFLAKGGTPWMP